MPSESVLLNIVFNNGKCNIYNDSFVTNERIFIILNYHKIIMWHDLRSFYAPGYITFFDRILVKYNPDSFIDCLTHTILSKYQIV